MKRTTVTYNKIATIIETKILLTDTGIKDGESRVFRFRTKKAFFNWARTEDAMDIRVSQNAKGVIKKMQVLGFDIEVSKDGCFEWETSLYCSK